MLQKAYSQSSLKKTAVYDWFSRFRGGRGSEKNCVFKSLMSKQC